METTLESALKKVIWQVESRPIEEISEASGCEPRAPQNKHNRMTVNYGIFGMFLVISRPTRTVILILDIYTIITVTTASSSQHIDHRFHRESLLFSVTSSLHLLVRLASR